jgi:hypothetical protein
MALPYRTMTTKGESLVSWRPDHLDWAVTALATNGDKINDVVVVHAYRDKTRGGSRQWTATDVLGGIFGAGQFATMAAITDLAVDESYRRKVSRMKATGALS